MYENDQRNGNQYSDQTVRQNGFQNSNKQPQQQRNLNYQYDNRHINENENGYMDMPRVDHGFDMPVHQQNGFYNQREQYNQSIKFIIKFEMKFIFKYLMLFFKIVYHRSEQFQELF